MGKAGTVLKFVGRNMLPRLDGPAREIAGSVKRMRDQVSDLKQVRESQRAYAREYDQVIAAGKSGPGEASAAEKFSIMVQHYGWTEPGLRMQMVATRRRRLAVLGAGLVAVAALAWVAFIAHVAFFAVMAPFVGLRCGLEAAKMAWHEFELETRALMPMRQFLSREDLFSRTFRLA